MAVFLAAFAVFAFYLAAIPIKLALCMRISTRPGFGTGMSIFTGWPALKAANRRSSGERKRKRRFKSVPLNALPSAAMSLRFLLRHAHPEFLSAEGRISASDAAATALICGCAQSLHATLLPILPPGRLRLHIDADFTGDRSDVLLQGMVSLRAGHIILAALISAWNYSIRSISHGKTSD